MTAYIQMLRPRFGPSRLIEFDHLGGVYDPPCPWCGEEIAGWHRYEAIITCVACGRESFLQCYPQAKIIGLRSPADLKYLEYRYGADIKDADSVRAALRRWEWGV